VPMEVMGLMLGEFVDDYTVRVVDVFAMPQSGTGVSVEAVDHVFQTNMLDMLKQTGRYGWSKGRADLLVTLQFFPPFRFSGVGFIVLADRIGNCYRVHLLVLMLFCALIVAVDFLLVRAEFDT
jgi:hypothetical protein